jgi:hypothetical protein
VVRPVVQRRVRRRTNRDPLLACTVAGVKSIDWLVGYMCADLGDRLRASWSIGL